MFDRIISMIVAVIAIIIGAFGLSLCNKSASIVDGGYTMDADSRQKNSAEMVKLVTAESEGKSLNPIYCYDDLGTFPYNRGIGVRRLAGHSGQRKLLLTEIEFLTCCAPKSNFIIYAGSAPCEKLPILLKMFPEKKMLLIDPNFHSFHAPNTGVSVVYQNVDRISKETLANTRKDMKLANKPRLNEEDKKRLKNISLQNRPKMYKSEYRGDMSCIDDSKHNIAMREIQSAFEEKHYKNFVTDIIQESDRVYIIQDYMTEALCKLIYQSIQIADTKIGKKTHICFISDLRSNFFGNEPIDLDFIFNDCLQLIFLKLLKPDFSMLKFHPPYMAYDQSLPLIAEMESGSNKHPIYPIIAADLKTCRDTYGLDFLSVYKKRNHIHKYFKASNIWLQAWAPTSSSEARLIISKEDIDSTYHDYDANLWDDKFQYHKMIRIYGYYGALYEQIRHLPNNTYDGCCDCALEMLILLNYIYRSEASADDTKINVSRLIELLKSPEAKEKLISLQNEIDSVVVYPVTQKCFFHGQVTKPLKEPIFYVHDYTMNEKRNWINQMHITDDKVITTRAIEYDCKKPPKHKIMPGIKISLAKNIPEISEQNKDRFAVSGYAYCKGDHKK